MFTIIGGIKRIDSQNLFSQDGNSSIRGHRFKVRRAKFKDVQAKFFITQRVMGAWDALPGGGGGSGYDSGI